MEFLLFYEVLKFLIFFQSLINKSWRYSRQAVLSCQALSGKICLIIHGHCFIHKVSLKIN